MEDIVQLDNQTYIKAASALADQRTRVLKCGEAFAIFDFAGDIKPIGTGAQGLYNNSTRYLSQMELKVGNRYPLYLSSTIGSDNSLFTADFGNSDVFQLNGTPLQKGQIHFLRSKFLTANGCFEKIEVTNFSNEQCGVELSFRFACDFTDMFEIRGVQRLNRGIITGIEKSADRVLIKYLGLDKISRGCEISFHPQPVRLTESLAEFHILCGPSQKTYIFTTVLFQDNFELVQPVAFETAYSRIKSLTQTSSAAGCHLTTSSERLNLWIDRSRSDVLLMATDTEAGLYPYAGIPWFNTVFGRDGIITALQYLWINPEIAKGVLGYLALHQAKESRPEYDCEPGKILHEFRKGEMVETGEVSFKNYYGSIDATPLFIILAGAYFEYTGDKPFIEGIWKNVEAALGWMTKHGDSDGDGFLEYLRKSPKGLENQGWKDSYDSVSHADGTLAQGPIALAEVQGYAYSAKLYAAMMAERLGYGDRAEELRLEASKLKSLFNTKFWDDELACYVMALDGEKNPCRVRSSNAGQCLFSKIVETDKASILAKTLLASDMYSGWGIRTLSSQAKRYNPMSYHNGAVWPHDNSLIAEGFSQYGLTTELLKLFDGFFRLATMVDLQRLPELFCGFEKREGEGPTLYPVACAPQAWAAGSLFLFLKAAMGMSISGTNNCINFCQPVLPSFVHELKITNLAAGKSTVDLSLHRHGDEVNVYVLHRTGDIKINIIK